MSEPTNPEASASEPTSTEEIQAGIDATRERLVESVDALAAKADVKARAREAAEETRQRAVSETRELGEKLRRAPRTTQALIVAVPVALVIVLIVRAVRRRAR